jgi:Tfp pilus assembly protein PilX
MNYMRHSSVAMRDIVRHIRHRHAKEGSALVLVLLITALLTTIAVSFLSTSRIEQIAAKNFTRQNAASGLAEMATQQAMAKIQQGFTVNGAGTTIITTQSGAIWQYTFSNGNCNAVATKNPVELFSANGTIIANLNNLQNPASNSSATANQFTITGNRTEQILVPMENITINGTIIGRVAYYVDDEGTKLNANSATGNRTTLNAGNRPQDITALVSSAASSFSNIINSTSSNTSSITGWSHFFRPEQVSAAVSGISGNHTPFISTATSSASTTANMSHLLTPWGTQRL